MMANQNGIAIGSLGHITANQNGIAIGFQMLSTDMLERLIIQKDICAIKELLESGYSVTEEDIDFAKTVDLEIVQVLTEYIYRIDGPKYTELKNTFQE